MATAIQLREKLAARQHELGKVFAEARIDGDDGKLDYNLVKCLGEEVKVSVDVAEKVRQMDLEMNEIAQEAETIEAADQAADAHAKREKAGPRPAHAAPGQKGHLAALRLLRWQAAIIEVIATPGKRTRRRPRRH